MKPEKPLVIFFTNESPALSYGLGTYTEQIKLAVSDQHIFDFINIRISVLANEIELDDSDGILTYIFPDNPNPQHLCNELIVFLKHELGITKCRQLVFHFNFPIHYFIALEVKKNFDASIIYTLHYMDWCIELGPNINNLKNLLETNPENKIFKKFVLEKAMMQISDKVCVATEHSKQILKKFYNVSDSNIVIIPLPNSIPRYPVKNTDICLIRNSFNLAEREKIILYVGRLDKNKNLNTLIKAFLHLQRDDVFLWIIGGGDYRTYLNEVPDSSWKKIHFWGYRDKTFISKAFQVADLGVVPSIYEEYGYVAVEFLCAGIPIIVNNTSGLAELSKKFPQIYKFNDTSESLSFALERFFDDYNEKFLLNSGILMNQFSIDTFKRNILAAYNDLVSMIYI